MVAIYHFNWYLFYFNFPFKNAFCSELMHCIPWTKSLGPWTAGPGNYHCFIRYDLLLLRQIVF